MADRARNENPIVDRRTVVVWVCLVSSMTLVSALLLALEPMPSGPGQSVAMIGVDRVLVEPVEPLATHVPIDIARWGAILIHHSGQPSGSASTLDAEHRAADLGGLGYHFVIGNGTGSRDGEVEVGARWLAQQPGIHATGDQAAWYNQHAIGICLIGDGDYAAPTEAQRKAVVDLVSDLRRRLNMPAQYVRLHSGIASTTSPGRLFPAGWFRVQLSHVPTQ